MRNRRALRVDDSVENADSRIELDAKIAVRVSFGRLHARLPVEKTGGTDAKVVTSGAEHRKAEFAFVVRLAVHRPRSVRHHQVVNVRADDRLSALGIEHVPDDGSSRNRDIPVVLGLVVQLTTIQERPCFSRYIDSHGPTAGFPELRGVFAVVIGAKVAGP